MYGFCYTRPRSMKWIGTAMYIVHYNMYIITIEYIGYTIVLNYMTSGKEFIAGQNWNICLWNMLVLITQKSPWNLYSFLKLFLQKCNRRVAEYYDIYFYAIFCARKSSPNFKNCINIKQFQENGESQCSIPTSSPQMFLWDI